MTRKEDAELKKAIIIAISAVLLAVCIVLAIVLPKSDADNGRESDPASDGTGETRSPAEPAPAEYMIDALCLSQNGILPSGCETVSAVMALQYSGVDITIVDFIDKYLPITEIPQVELDNELHGESPYEYFLGSPYSDLGIGCYSPVIKKALNDALQDYGSEVNAELDADSLKVADLGGMTLRELCENYVCRDIPVILWATIRMQPVNGGTRWYLPDGSEFYWKSPEHCLLLVGYDEAYYYFNDPQEGKDVAYPKADVEKAYAELGSQALAITFQWLL